MNTAQSRRLRNANFVSVDTLTIPALTAGGQRTSYHVSEFLSRRHEMHLLCFGRESELAVFDGQGMEIFRSWDIVPVSRGTRMGGVLSSPRLRPEFQ